MATRSMIRIDEELCNGCGDCVPSCAEGAIQIIDGKAKLVADNLCDGLGACLGDCPEGALTIEEREAVEFDESAVEHHLRKQADKAPPVVQNTPAPAHDHGPAGGCPGSRMFQFDTAEKTQEKEASPMAPVTSELRQWPIQLHLVSPTAPYFEKADVLLAADCVAFAIGDFHQTQMKGRSLAIACPKLDDGQDIYLQKLVAMIDEANINTLTVMVMEVPCCNGLVQLAKQAMLQANRKIPVKVVVIGIKGGAILSDDWV
ncbi:MAG: 4Fe-4S ferredoxin [Proteobacteria bacterium]|nr:4Fe-4S ferredoxin [Pseudomonadota bacterium]